MQQAQFNQPQADDGDKPNGIRLNRFDLKLSVTKEITMVLKRVMNCFAKEKCFILSIRWMCEWRLMFRGSLARSYDYENRRKQNSQQVKARTAFGTVFAIFLFYGFRLGHRASHFFRFDVAQKKRITFNFRTLENSSSREDAKCGKIHIENS